jgi:hypothetical protein
LLQQADASTQHSGLDSAVGLAAETALQQVQSQTSQAQVPVQQPQQLQAVLHTHELPAPETFATASAPVVTNANTEPTRNLYIASSSKRENSERDHCALRRKRDDAQKVRCDAS